MIDPGLHGSVVLITGGNTGIGAATARAFGAQGALVAVHYLERDAPSDPGVSIEHSTPGRDAAEAVGRAVADCGGRSFLIEGDLSDPRTPARLFQELSGALGRVHVLVNNAAHCESPDSLLTTSAAGLDRHFAVNTRAPVLLMKEFALARQRREAAGGTIINISTDSARAFATQIGYGASKAALEAFTRSVAIELGPLGITVNAIAPGPVQTGWMSDELEQQVAGAIPLGRAGTPADIADAVVFLASRQARWITGQVIQVAGGNAL